MRGFVFCIVLFAGLFVAIGYSRGWLAFSHTDRPGDEVHIGATLDQRGMEHDAHRLKEKTKEAVQEGADALRVPKADASKVKTTKGKINRLDTAAQCLFLQADPMAETRIDVDGATKVTLNGKEAQFSALRTGDATTVAFVVKDGKKVAVTIEAAR